MVCAVAAVLVLSLLPAEHLHTFSVGQPIVHRHVIDDTAQHGAASIDHDGHGGVTTLEPTFVAARQYDVHRPLITVELVLVVPDRRVVGRVEPMDAVMTHGPPIRPPSLRAPPA
jgi:hypothetical protein